MAYQVELLYTKSFEKEVDAEKHCLFIAEFIRACGWDEQEYMDRWLREEDRQHPLVHERNINLS